MTEAEFQKQLDQAHAERVSATTRADRMRAYLRTFCVAAINDSAEEDGPSGVEVLLDHAKVNPSMGFRLSWHEDGQGAPVITAGQIGRAIELVGHDGRRLLPAEPAPVDVLAEAVTRLDGVAGRLSTLEDGARQTTTRLRLMEWHLQSLLDSWDQLTARVIESGAVVPEQDLEQAKRARLFLNKGLGTT